MIVKKQNGELKHWEISVGISPIFDTIMVAYRAR